MEWIRKRDSDAMREKCVQLEVGELPLLYFPLLEETGLVSHCFTTRRGGVSQGIFSSLNVSFSRGDDPKAVHENFERLAQAFGIAPEQFVCSDQTHTVHVRKITAADAGCGLTRERDYTDVDGLITNEPGLMLSTFYADCVPLYFVDLVHRAIGLSHSGWRGTVGRMGAVTLDAMQKEYGTRPEDALCAVGPSICADCYEVSEDVYRAFADEFSQECEEFFVRKKNGKYQLDLWKANERILLHAGVRPEHIAVAGICTCCNSKALFSHRASGGKRGNLGAFLMLH